MDYITDFSSDSESHFVLATYSLTRYRTKPKNNRIIICSNNLDNFCKLVESYIIRVCYYRKKEGLCLCRYDDYCPDTSKPAIFDRAVWTIKLRIYGYRINFIADVSGSGLFTSKVLPRMPKIEAYVSLINHIISLSFRELEEMYNQLFWKKPMYRFFKKYRMYLEIARYRKQAMLLLG